MAQNPEDAINSIAETKDTSYNRDFQAQFKYAVENKILLLPNCNLTDLELINIVIPFLKANPAIKALDIQDNQITSKSANDLTKCNLEKLNVDGNFLRNEGALLLGCGNFVTLHISNNVIFDEGVVNFGLNKYIKNLFINSNQISNAGLIHLSNNTTLISMDIGINKINDAGINQAFSFLERLDYLDVTGNDISDEVFERLENISQDRQKHHKEQKQAFLGSLMLRQNDSPAVLHFYQHVKNKFKPILSNIFEFSAPNSFKLNA